MRVKRGEYGAAPVCKGGGNGSTPRKPADQQHHSARFPRAKIRVLLVGGKMKDWTTQTERLLSLLKKRSWCRKSSRVWRVVAYEFDSSLVSRLISLVHTGASAVCAIGCCPAPVSYGIRKVFPYKSAIGSEACRAGLLNCDPIAKGTSLYTCLASNLSRNESAKFLCPYQYTREMSVPILLVCCHIFGQAWLPCDNFAPSVGGCQVELCAYGRASIFRRLRTRVTPGDPARSDDEPLACDGPATSPSACQRVSDGRLLRVLLVQLRRNRSLEGRLEEFGILLPQHGSVSLGWVRALRAKPLEEDKRSKLSARRLRGTSLSRSRMAQLPTDAPASKVDILQRTRQTVVEVHKTHVRPDSVTPTFVIRADSYHGPEHASANQQSWTFLHCFELYLALNCFTNTEAPQNHEIPSAQKSCEVCRINGEAITCMPLPSFFKVTGFFTNCIMNWQGYVFTDKIDLKHEHTEVKFVVGSQFIRHALSDPEPIGDFHGDPQVLHCYVLQTIELSSQRVKESSPGLDTDVSPHFAGLRRNILVASDAILLACAAYVGDISGYFASVFVSIAPGRYMDASERGVSGIAVTTSRLPVHSGSFISVWPDGIGEWVLTLTAANEKHCSARACCDETSALHFRRAVPVNALPDCRGICVKIAGRGCVAISGTADYVAGETRWPPAMQSPQLDNGCPGEAPFATIQMGHIKISAWRGGCMWDGPEGWGAKLTGPHLQRDIKRGRVPTTPHSKFVFYDVLSCHRITRIKQKRKCIDRPLHQLPMASTIFQSATSYLPDGSWTNMTRVRDKTAFPDYKYRLLTTGTPPALKLYTTPVIDNSSTKYIVIASDSVGAGQTPHRHLPTYKQPLVFDTHLRTVAQSSPFTVTADNQSTVDIGIFVHKTIESSLQVSVEQRRNANHEGKGISLRKPADQRHHPARFPRVEIRERTRCVGTGKFRKFISGQDRHQTHIQCGETANEHTAEAPVCRGLWSLAYRSLNSRNFPISTAEVRARFTLVGGESSSRFTTAAPSHRRKDSAGCGFVCGSARPPGSQEQCDVFPAVPSRGPDALTTVMFLTINSRYITTPSQAYACCLNVLEESYVARKFATARRCYVERKKKRFWTTLNVEVLRADEGEARSPIKTRRRPARFPRAEPGSPIGGRRVVFLTTNPPRPLHVFRALLSFFVGEDEITGCDARSSRVGRSARRCNARHVSTTPAGRRELIASRSLLLGRALFAAVFSFVARACIVNTQSQSPCRGADPRVPLCIESKDLHYPAINPLTFVASYAPIHEHCDMENSGPTNLRKATNSVTKQNVLLWLTFVFLRRIIWRTRASLCWLFASSQWYRLMLWCLFDASRVLDTDDATFMEGINEIVSHRLRAWPCSKAMTLHYYNYGWKCLPNREMNVDGQWRGASEQAGHHLVTSPSAILDVIDHDLYIAPTEVQKSSTEETLSNTEDTENNILQLIRTIVARGATSSADRNPRSSSNLLPPPSISQLIPAPGIQCILIQFRRQSHQLRRRRQRHRISDRRRIFSIQTLEAFFKFNFAMAQFTGYAATMSSKAVTC
ncbi:hypothetical protein PR048_010469 [Dryococelus australis]|uniref:Uncharacterized protein n=1 Tax=Dryococelus australis TaxID=614101 RepID=A0ABQ9I2U4_9NEOP|nr:hypothetical protein PR048_010469 [Dryococelus australis]